ncbi:MAG TPA: hypothetical protein VGN95_25265 [Pyrinomonadaceae bacterium]|jgi:hypothetical protein|nr:hypothetical protein [Pyrinomonadaceae bacterium]
MTTKKSSTPRKRNASNEQGLSSKEHLELEQIAEFVVGILSNEYTPDVLSMAILEGLARLDCHAEANHNTGYVGAILVTDAISRKAGAR